MGNIWCPRHDTHPHNTHRHLQAHTNTFNLQSERPLQKTHTHIHILAGSGFSRNWSDGFWLIVCKCWNIIKPFFHHLGKCVCMGVWMCVGERLFQADGGSHCPFCGVNWGKLSSMDFCLSSSPLLSSPLPPIPSAFIVLKRPRCLPHHALFFSI